MIERWVGRRDRGGEANEEPALTVARADAPGRPSLHAENQSPEARDGIGEGEGGGWAKKRKKPQK